METIEGTHAYELRAQPTQNLSQRGINELFAVVRSEMQLARFEVEQKASAGRKAGRSFAKASIFLVLAGIAFSAAAVAALSAFMQLWVAALIVSVAYGIVALVLALNARTTWPESVGCCRIILLTTS